MENAARPNTSGHSDDDTRAGLILLNHHQIENISADLFTMMPKRAVPTMSWHIPNLPEVAYGLLNEKLATAFRGATQDLLISNVRLYSAHLTSDEVAQINAFYGTSADNKMLQTLPILIQQSLHMDQEWIQKLDRYLPKRWTERLKCEGYLKK